MHCIASAVQTIRANGLSKDENRITAPGREGETTMTKIRPYTVHSGHRIHPNIALNSPHTNS